MLPTPSTGHTPFERVYEPAEDSYLLLDTLSSNSEKGFLQARFGHTSASPVVVEIGSGSGVVLAFVLAHAELVLARGDVLGLGLDVNRFACVATARTVEIARRESEGAAGLFLGSVLGDLVGSLRTACVDVLVFNPPYVPTAEVPCLPLMGEGETSFERDSELLALSYAGGIDGMETTNRLLDLLPTVLSSIGVSYILLCAQNKPEVVKEKIRAWGTEWHVETVGSSGKKAGWEKLQVIRIWRNIVLPDAAAF